uniref:Uncharacterized protein n=1 Tax=Anguilla anguilla TaxID=7936 RepID=A0A0E9RJL0_ANGAN
MHCITVNKYILCWGGLLQDDGVDRAGAGILSLYQAFVLL